MFAKAGAILPLTSQIEGKAFLENPETLTLKCFAGADGSFTLYEDDNETTAYQEGHFAETRFTQDWAQGIITLHPASGDTALLPKTRSYTLELVGYDRLPERILVNGREIAPLPAEEIPGVLPTQGSVRLTLPALPVDATICLCFRTPALAANPVEERLFDYLNEAELPFDDKTRIYQTLTAPGSLPHRLSALTALQLSDDLTRLLTELLTAEA